MSNESVFQGHIQLYGSATTYSALLGRYFSPFLYFPATYTLGMTPEAIKKAHIEEFGTTRITNLGRQAVALIDHKDHLSAEILSEDGIPLPFFRKLVDLYGDLRIEYRFHAHNKIIHGTISHEGETGPYYFDEDGDSILE